MAMRRPRFSPRHQHGRGVNGERSMRFRDICAGTPSAEPLRESLHSYRAGSEISADFWRLSSQSTSRYFGLDELSAGLVTKAMEFSHHGAKLDIASVEGQD